MSQITLADSGELPASRPPGSGERQQAVFFPGGNPPLHQRPLGWSAKATSKKFVPWGNSLNAPEDPSVCSTPPPPDLPPPPRHPDHPRV